MANHNISRLTEDIKREVSAALRQVKDSRISSGLITVTRCELTNDLSFCKVYISSLDGETANKSVLKGLESATGFIKKQISQRVKMRKMPQLIFVMDNSLEYYQHIEKVLNNLPKLTEDKPQDEPKEDSNIDD